MHFMAQIVEEQQLRSLFFLNLQLLYWLSVWVFMTFGYYQSHSSNQQPADSRNDISSLKDNKVLSHGT